MKISELQIRQGNADIEGTIKEINEPRSFSKFGRQLRVADAILEDESGTIKLSLWNDDVDKFKVGDKVRIVNGYVNEFQGEKQLTAGRYGKMEKIGEGEVEAVEQTELPEEEAVKEKAEEEKESEAEESEEIEEKPEKSEEKAEESEEKEKSEEE